VTSIQSQTKISAAGGISGTETLLSKTLKTGGAGTITATVNINPREIDCIDRLWQVNEDTQAAQVVADQTRSIISDSPLAAVIKSVMQT